MYYFYVLYSLKDGRLYKGYTSDLGQRFLRHRSGGVKSTKHRRSLVLMYTEQFGGKQEAQARERWAKSKEGGPALRTLLIGDGLLDGEGKLGGGEAG